MVHGQDRRELEAGSGEVRKQWGKLTDDDLEQARGERDKLVGRIQERYGIAKDEAGHQLDEWERTQKF